MPRACLKPQLQRLKDPHWPRRGLTLDPAPLPDVARGAVQPRAGEGPEPRRGPWTPAGLRNRCPCKEAAGAWSGGGWGWLWQLGTQ